MFDWMVVEWFDRTPTCSTLGGVRGFIVRVMPAWLIPLDKRYACPFGASFHVGPRNLNRFFHHFEMLFPTPETRIFNDDGENHLNVASILVD